MRALQKVATAGASPEGRSSSMPVGASRRKMGGVIPGFSEAEVEVGPTHPCITSVGTPTTVGSNEAEGVLEMQL